jgi:hypothetical protein
MGTGSVTREEQQDTVVEEPDLSCPGQLMGFGYHPQGTGGGAEGLHALSRPH